MKTILFYIFLPVLYLFMLIPFPVIYIFSDIIYFVLYYIIGYRKNVVFSNLRNSFPEKSDEEIKKIAKKFYRYLCDVLLETFKTLTVSKSVSLKHCHLTERSKAMLDGYYAQQKSLIFVLGHYGNWEWSANAFSLDCKHQLYVIYHPITNKQFNWLMHKIRTRFGSKFIPMREIFKEMIRTKNEINATAFVADQTPSNENAYWTKFLNQDTPVFWGTEQIAKKMNYPVLYVTINRVKRGYYEIETEVLTENPKDTSEGEISEAHTRKLEADIIKKPEIWLWSHRRWKHKRSNQE